MWNINDIRKEFSGLLRNENFTIDKTGALTVEIIGVQFMAMQPTIFGSVNDDYVKRELQWYESKSLNVNDIPAKVPEIWKKIATPNGLINSNYGWCIWSKENGSQYDGCLRELICNKNSRRAIMIYTRPSMHEDFCKDGMSDFICTNTVQYFIRENSMHAIVSMRSNDAWAGYRNDYAWQLHVLKKLLNDYNRLTESNVDLGHIIWNVGNLHVYSSQFYLIDHFDLTGQHSISKEEYRKFYPKVRPYAN